MRRYIFQELSERIQRPFIALVAVQAMTPGAIAKHFDATRQADLKRVSYYQ
jgi:hypothetical protein